MSTVRLGSALTVPKVARNLQLIEQAKNDTGEKSNQVLDLAPVLVLETGDTSGVFDQLLRLLTKVRAEHATDTATATVA